MRNRFRHRRAARRGVGTAVDDPCGMKHFAFLTAVLVVLGLARSTQADTIQLAWNPNTDANLAGYVVSYGTAVNTYTSTVEVG